MSAGVYSLLLLGLSVYGTFSDDLITASTTTTAAPATTTAAPTTTTAAPLDCGRPPYVSYATHNGNGSVFSHGSKVTYNCRYGYGASGSQEKQCRNGTWFYSGPRFSCSRITCAKPASIFGATYDPSFFSRYSRYSMGAIVTYDCNFGYYLNSTTYKITCQQNRTWSLPMPQCVKKDCGIPLEVAGANVSYGLTTYSSRAYYKCHKGYTLYTSYGTRSSSSRLSSRCMSSGEWGSRPSCKPKVCGFPPIIKDGTRSTRGSHIYGDQVTYTCNHGFMISNITMITCKENGFWSETPKCRLISCGQAPVVSYANANITGFAEGYYGSPINYTCADGYEMTGVPYVHCRADGTWTQTPICSMVNCRAPPFIHYGIHKWNTTTYNSVAEYSCEEGYRLIGVHSVYCLSSGDWSEPPLCDLDKSFAARAQAFKAVEGEEDSENSILIALGIACALLALITLVSTVAVVYKCCFANNVDRKKLFPCLS